MRQFGLSLAVLFLAGAQRLLSPFAQIDIDGTRLERRLTGPDHRPDEVLEPADRAVLAKALEFILPGNVVAGPTGFTHPFHALPLPRSQQRRRVLQRQNLFRGIVSEHVRHRLVGEERFPAPVIDSDTLDRTLDQVAEPAFAFL